MKTRLFCTSLWKPLIVPPIRNAMNRPALITPPKLAHSYVSILYLRMPPGFRILLRGQEVHHHNLVDGLMYKQELTCGPQRGADHVSRETNMVAVVTIRFVNDAMGHLHIQGFNVYHKNRLIKPFWKICYMDANPFRVFRLFVDMMKHGHGIAPRLDLEQQQPVFRPNLEKCVRDRNSLHHALEEERLLRESDDEEMRRKLKLALLKTTSCVSRGVEPMCVNWT